MHACWLGTAFVFEERAQPAPAPHPGGRSSYIHKSNQQRLSTRSRCCCRRGDIRVSLCLCFAPQESRWSIPHPFFTIAFSTPDGPRPVPYTPIAGVLECVRVTVRSQGPRALYKGALTSALGQVPNNAIGKLWESWAEGHRRDDWLTNHANSLWGVWVDACVARSDLRRERHGPKRRKRRRGLLA